MINLPKIALGAWSWGCGDVGGDRVFGNHLEEKDLKAVFDAALSNNLTLWDTAYIYGMGASETILGNFVRKEKRENIILSTKFTPQIAEETDDAMQLMIDVSKEHLHTDYIDIYWIHNPYDVEKWTPKLIPLAKSRQIKQIGVSNHNLAEMKRVNEILAQEGLKVSVVQNHYSLLHRSSEKAGILEYCKNNNITFFSYMVLEQGALTGKYNESHPFPSGSQRADSYNALLSKISPLISEMEQIGKKYNASPAQIAIAWAIAKGTLPIIGVTKAKQVEQASDATRIKLTNDEIHLLEQIGDDIAVSTLREWEKEMI